MNRIKLILLIFFLNFSYSQSAEELKKFMQTYDKLKIDQEANEVVKKGIESEKGIEDGPVKLLVSPADIYDYYNEKILSIQDDLKKLNNLLMFTDSVPPINHFGYNFFFLRDSVNYIDNIKINPSYQLGYGDEIIISVWGEVQQYEKKIIERDGTIYVENVGLLYIGGMSLEKCKSYIFNRFSKVYSTLGSKPQSSFLDVSISKIKKINITVSGHVKYPGNYVVNPSIDYVNLLILAGGITNSGTLRKIFVNRNGSVLDSIDFYPLISGLKSPKKINFIDGDIITVPPRGETIAIVGAVKKPAYYEIKNDISKNLFLYAGGFTRFSSDKIFVYRKNLSNNILNIKDVDLYNPLNGDSLVVSRIRNNSKFLSLSIDNSKSFDIPWFENISYNIIIESAGITKPNIKKMELVRKLPDNTYQRYILENYEEGEFKFLPNDFLSIQLFYSYEKLNTVTVLGEVASPGSYPLSFAGETLNSLIDRSGGFLGNASIINALVKRDTSKFGSLEGNIVLAPNDSIFVGSFNGTVNLLGEIHNPGKVEWTDQRKARDYLNLGGGLTSYADKKNIVYITPYGEAYKINRNSKIEVLPGSSISVSRKIPEDLVSPVDRFQQVSALISSIVTLAILANSNTFNN